MKFTITGVLSLDGVYELDFDDGPLTMRELHWVKQIAGVRLNELQSASVAGDSDLIVAFAVIALVRAGKVTRDNVTAATDLLLDAEAGNLTVEDDEVEEDDAVPPEVAPPNVSGDGSGLRKSTESSSVAFNGIGVAPLVTVPASTGQPG